MRPQSARPAPAPTNVRQEPHWSVTTSGTVIGPAAGRIMRSVTLVVPAGGEYVCDPVLPLGPPAGLVTAITAFVGAPGCWPASPNWTAPIEPSPAVRTTVSAPPP